MNRIHRRRHTRFQTLLILGLSGLIAQALACSARLGSLPDPSPEPDSIWSGSDGLEIVDTGDAGLFLVKPDHQLGRYDDLLIDRVGFRYSPGQQWLSRRDEARIRSMVRATVQGTEDGAIGLAEDVGPCVLSVDFFVTDLEIYDPIPLSGSNTSIVRSFGEATMVMELRDSLTDEPLARLLQRRSLGGGISNGGTQSSLHRLGRVLSAAMKDMGTQIQRITPPSAGSMDAECKGGLARVALGRH